MKDLADYKIGKLVPPPLFTDYNDDVSSDLLEQCFAKDVYGCLPVVYRRVLILERSCLFLVDGQHSKNQFAKQKQ